MSISINVQYVVREQKRIELERHSIALQIAAWVKRCADFQTFTAALSGDELSQLSEERARSKHCRRVRPTAPVLVAMEKEQTQGGNDERATTTECALQGAG